MPLDQPRLEWLLTTAVNILWTRPKTLLRSCPWVTIWKWQVIFVPLLVYWCSKHFLESTTDKSIGDTSSRLSRISEPPSPPNPPNLTFRELVFSRSPWIYGLPAFHPQSCFCTENRVERAKTAPYNLRIRPTRQTRPSMTKTSIFCQFVPNTRVRWFTGRQTSDKDPLSAR